MSGDTRASVHEPRDAIVIDPDPVNNNTPAQESSSSQAEQNNANSVVIGKPAEGFNIHQSHNSVMYQRCHASQNRNSSCQESRQEMQRCLKSRKAS